MKKHRLLKISVSLIMAVLMLVLGPVQIFAANFYVTKELLKNNCWWTPEIGVIYVAGTDNASMAYYHYVPTEMTGAYDFIVYSSSKVPMSGAVYTKSCDWSWWKPVQLAQKDAYRQNGFTITLDNIIEDKEYWFAIGGQPNCTGTYYFSVKPHVDWNSAYYHNGKFWGKVWTRTTDKYLNYNEESVNKISFLSPYEANVVLSYLTSDMVDAFRDYKKDGWETWDAIEEALEAVGYIWDGVSDITESVWMEIIGSFYSLFTTTLSTIVETQSPSVRAKKIAELIEQIEDAGDVHYYWSEDGNRCHSCSNWIKIEEYSYDIPYSMNPDSPRIYWDEVIEHRAATIDFPIFYGPEYAQGTWSNGTVFR